MIALNPHCGPAETWVSHNHAFPDFGRGFASHTKRKEEVA